MNTRLRCPWRCSPVRTSVICLRCWNGRFLTSEATGVEHLRFHSPPPSYGAGGPQDRRGRASVAVQGDFRSEIFEDRLCGLPAPPPSGAPPPYDGYGVDTSAGGWVSQFEPAFGLPQKCDSDF